MKNKERNNLNILSSILSNPDDINSVVPFGYYLSSKQDHLYNLGFYIDEFENYKEFIKIFRTRHKLCNDILSLTIKKYPNLLSTETIYGSKDTSAKIKVICDQLFSYSHPKNKQNNEDVSVDEQLASSFTASMINPQYVNVKVIVKKNTIDYMDICTKINLSNQSEEVILHAVLNTIKTACRIYIKKESYESKK